MTATNGNGKKPIQKPIPKGVGRNRLLTPGNPGNSGGKAGRSGRKPEVYRDLCRSLLESPETVKSLQSILKDNRHPHFAAIYKHLAEHGHGKPVQPISGEGGGPVRVLVVRESPDFASDD